MAVQTTGSFPKHLWPGLHATFGTNYNEKTMQHAMLFEMASSDKAYEEVVEGTSYGLAAVKNESSSILYDDREQTNTATFTHVTTALGAKISREAIEDNKYERPTQEAAKLLGLSLRQTKETFGFNVLNNGFDSNYPGPDGVELFSTAHPTRFGNQSNELDVAADLTESSIEDMIIDIRKAVNARGIRIELQAMCLWVPPEEMFNATRILNSTLRSGTADNDTNALREMGMLAEGVKVSEFLTDPDAWFIKTNAPNGLMGFNRRAAQISEDNEFDTENACIKATERFQFGFADWRGIYGSPGS